jgi:hypothetical protein
LVHPWPLARRAQPALCYVVAALGAAEPGGAKQLGRTATTMSDHDNRDSHDNDEQQRRNEPMTSSIDRRVM